MRIPAPPQHEPEASAGARCLKSGMPGSLSMRRAPRSSALCIEKGCDTWRDLASHGRTVSSTRDAVFREFSARGGYPLVHTRRDGKGASLADQPDETVIKRVIQRGLRLGEGR